MSFQNETRQFADMIDQYGKVVAIIAGACLVVGFLFGLIF